MKNHGSRNKANERMLWLSVIAQAVTDSAGKIESLRDSARAWTKYEDFLTVCGYAQVMPRQVERAIMSGRGLFTAKELKVETESE